MISCIAIRLPLSRKSVLSSLKNDSNDLIQCFYKFHWVSFQADILVLFSIHLSFTENLIPSNLIGKVNQISETNSSVIKQKDESQKGCFKKTKHTKCSEKRIFLIPLIRTHTCAYQGIRDVRFSENLSCFVFLKHPFWDSPFCLIRLDLNNCSFAVTRLTQLWSCQLKIFYCRFCIFFFLVRKHFQR